MIATVLARSPLVPLRAAPPYLVGAAQREGTDSWCRVQLIAVATAACYFPAREAMKIEPIVALRHE